MPSIAKRGEEDETGGIGALASDINGFPTVAFPAPSSANDSGLMTCEGPVNLVWFHAGAFSSADALFDLRITNVGVPQNQSQSQSQPAPSVPITVTVARSQRVVADNHFYAWQQVDLPPGSYILDGQSVDSRSKTKYIPSEPFSISAGADTSCVSINPNPSLPQTTPSTTTASASSTRSPSTPASTHGTSSPAAASHTPLHESASTTSIDHRSQVIAGSVAGSFAIVLIIAIFYVLMYMRRRRRVYDNPNALAPREWRRSRKLQRLDSRPTPLLPPPPVPPGTPDTASVYLTVPTPARLRFPSEAERGDSFTTQRSALHARWGWAVPLTPMFNLLLARRSSVGSTQFVSPVGYETPLPSSQALNFDRSRLASTQGHSRLTSLSGAFDYDRERLHSLSEFRWASDFPRDRDGGDRFEKSSVTIERLEKLDEASDGETMTPGATPVKTKPKS
ncbi:hypothetical protein AURDEDRAFT_112010 [Auricularia subglabra TFB-10046 SS5]|nr:hypothetical protein AURDEDRAFT_112010 [Auricularia subglabra TFB-10046 SS5]